MAILAIRQSALALARCAQVVPWVMGTFLGRSIILNPVGNAATLGLCTNRLQEAGKFVSASPASLVGRVGPHRMSLICYREIDQLMDAALKTDDLRSCFAYAVSKGKEMSPETRKKLYEYICNLLLRMVLIYPDFIDKIEKGLIQVCEENDPVSNEFGAAIKSEVLIGGKGDFFNKVDEK